MITRTHVAASLLVALLAAGCLSAPDDPGLRVAGVMLPMGSSISNSPPGEPVALGSLILCLREPGTVTLESVHLVDSRLGLAVDSFAVRPNPFPRGELGIGSARDTLVALGLHPSGPQVVDSQCPEDDNDETWTGGYEVVFQVSYPGPVDAPPEAGSVEVSYTYGESGHGTLAIPYAVRLCPAVCP